MKLSQIINEIRAVGSTNTKKSILQTHRDNADLQKLFYATYDGRINYWIKADKEWEGTGSAVLTCEVIDDVLRVLDGRQKTGNAAREYLKNVVESLEADEADLLIMMVNGDLECKASSTLANTTWPGLILEFPVMLAGKFNEKTAKEFYAAEHPGKSNMIVQTKSDGGRVEYVASEDMMYSRNGSPAMTHDHFSFLKDIFAGYVVDGELVSIDPVTGKVRDRKTSNGLFNKAIRQTLSREEAATLHYVVWDLIPEDEFWNGIGTEDYRTRLATLSEKMSMIPDIFKSRIAFVESRAINFVHEAQDFYAEMLERKEEGAMLKLFDMKWSNTRSNHVLKLKEELDATLYCYAVKMHRKKEGWIGSLECRSSCGKIDVSIGSGLNDDLRQRPSEYFIGRLIDMKYNALILAKNCSTYSMFLPIYKNIRVDVDEADTLEKLL